MLFSRKIYMLLGLLLLCPSSQILSSPPKMPEVLDKVIVIVNSQVITQNDLDQQSKLSAHKNAQHSNLDQLINRALQLDVAKKANLLISEKAITETIEKIAFQNNITVAQLQQSLTDKGISEKAYREQLRQALLIRQVQEKFVAPQVKITEQDIADAKNKQDRMTKNTVLQDSHSHDQYHVIDILVSEKDSAQALLKKLQKKPAMVKSLVHTHPGTIVTDMGFRSMTEIPEVFIKTLLTLQIGQFSQPIRAPNGLHILQLITIKKITLLQPGASILSPQQIAYEQKFAIALQAWLKKLRAQASIIYVK